MKNVDEQEFLRSAARLLDEVMRTGSALAITRQGEVIATLSPQGFRARSLLGLHKGQVTIRGDINNVSGDTAVTDAKVSEGVPQ